MLDLIHRCKIATEQMYKSLKVKNLRRQKMTLELMEVCSKNGNLFFHKQLAQPIFQDLFLVLLKKVPNSQLNISREEAKQNQ